MKVLITGSSGFIGKNLMLHLLERKDIQVVCFNRHDSVAQLPFLLDEVDFVIHLAGVNRPQDPGEFVMGNVDLTRTLCQFIGKLAIATGRKIPIIYTSSIQAEELNPYGASKLEAENILLELARNCAVPVHIFRLPNVFGKWCKPNYNSVVATFCHNIARDLPILVNNPDSPITLVYVDDVIKCFLRLIDNTDMAISASKFSNVVPHYATTVGKLAQHIQTFKDSRSLLTTERVGTGLIRALYATYLSYLPPEMFSYSVPKYEDQRGVFVEMLKTLDSGQFSYFTAYPGVTRGGHYHHSKTEKFLVVKGKALFKFRHMQTCETYELLTSGEKAEVVETVPGWTHDISNVGSEEMIVILWANELFDRDQPDTFTCPL